MEGFNDATTGESERRGFAEVVKELEERFPYPDKIISESDKKGLYPAIWRIFTG